MKKSGYSEDYIRSQFKLFTGKTPVEFLTETRINHACYLIDIYKDSMNLSEISEKCGYTDYVYFSRQFKKVMGISPKNYMKSLK
ncbi:MAG: helix-turn-helix transcriptional regulator [Clostridia bacterium]|nr:helix-turn-helix transcriptional regulator [Clostridia bacterium]